jgi:hypothetical protein
MRKLVYREYAFRMPFLKGYLDLWRLYELYSTLVRTKGAPARPLRMFRLGFLGIAACILYLALAKHPFGKPPWW